MANAKPIHTESFVAGEDLSDYQYHGMTMLSSRSVERFDATTDIPVGVLMNDPESGEEAEVMAVGRCPVVLSENVTSLPQLMRFDGDGHACNFDVDTDVTTYCAGQFLQTGSSGEKVEAIINCATPFRGEE